MTYVLSMATQRNLDLAAMLPSELANFVRLCLPWGRVFRFARVGCDPDRRGCRQCSFSICDGCRPKRRDLLGERRNWWLNRSQSRLSLGRPLPSTHRESGPVGFASDRP
jgi:hypothetical protein